MGMQRILLAGAAGFIGARVAWHLLEAGHEVVGIDNLNDAYDPRLKLWRLQRLHSAPRFHFTQVDLVDRAGIDRLFATHAPLAAVLNLAARAGVRASVTDPWSYYAANCTGTLNLLEASREHGVPKFVLASTSSLYGRHNQLPFREDADASRPLSPYAASKGAAETLCHSYHHLHGLDVTVLRYFTVYGPAGRPDMSVFRFVRDIAEGTPIVIFGDGNQQRDFTYVDDIARGTVAALRPLGYEVINLGCDRPVPLARLVALIAQQVGREPIIEYRPAHSADVAATWADIGKAARLLDWRPAVQFEQGVAEAVAWYRAHRDFVLSLDRGET